jgi:2,4-dichlorophenol 6-monooxygenase
LIQTDVLVIGCGPAGLTAALALARQGARVMAVTKHQQLAPTPRAHVTNQRSFEILRDLGLESQAIALVTRYADMPDQLFVRSLVGTEFGRIKGLGVDEPHNSHASPCAIADLPQNLLEPLLFQAALRAGARMRFSTELLSFTQEAGGVTAILLDHLTEERITVDARYIIGADGGRSMVASALDLPFEGPGKIGGSLNILFECDLAPYVAHRPGLLYFLVRTAEDVDGPGLGILRCVKPWTSWLMIKGYAAGQETPNLSHAEAAGVVRDYLGVPDLELRITGVDPWDLNSRWATVYHRRRVFCMGDAVHRHAPSNGLGSNTAIQDAWNLAWKLDLVLRGKADATLLDSYSEERVPIGKQVVVRATKSLESYAPVLNAIGVLDSAAPEQGVRNMAEIAVHTPAGAARRDALHDSIHAKIYEYQTRGVELNHLYRSSAIIDDGQEPPESDLDLELHYRPTSCPGARLPHAWVQLDGRRLSTLDLVGKGRFTVLTGIGGDVWIAAAAAVASRFGIDIAAIPIGPGCAITDLYFEWSERREIAEDGCLLVRPDGYVAWRCLTANGRRPEEELNEVLARILGAGSPTVSVDWDSSYKPIHDGEHVTHDAYSG